MTIPKKWTIKAKRVDSSMTTSMTTSPRWRWYIQGRCCFWGTCSSLWEALRIVRDVESCIVTGGFNFFRHEADGSTTHLVLDSEQRPQGEA